MPRFPAQPWATEEHQALERLTLRLCAPPPHHGPQVLLKLFQVLFSRPEHQRLAALSLQWNRPNALLCWEHPHWVLNR